MPKFLYTIIALAIISWVYWVNLLTQSAPDSRVKIVQFLISLGIALSFTLSLAVFVILIKKSPNFTNMKYLYRKSLKISVTIASGIILYLGLRAYSLANILNTLLLLGIYVIVLSNTLRRR